MFDKKVEEAVHELISGLRKVANGSISCVVIGIADSASSDEDGQFASSIPTEFERSCESFAKDRMHVKEKLNHLPVPRFLGWYDSYPDVAVVAYGKDDAHQIWRLLDNHNINLLDILGFDPNDSDLLPNVEYGKSPGDYTRSLPRISDEIWRIRKVVLGKLTRDTDRHPPAPFIEVGMQYQVVNMRWLFYLYIKDLAKVVECLLIERYRSKLQRAPDHGCEGNDLTDPAPPPLSSHELGNNPQTNTNSQSISKSAFDAVVAAGLAGVLQAASQTPAIDRASASMMSLFDSDRSKYGSWSANDWVAYCKAAKRTIL